MTYVDPSTASVLRSGSETDEDIYLSVDIEELDLQGLAEAVVALLKQELWLGGEREGWRRLW